MTILRSSLVVGAATVASRLLGFVRDILIAAFLGAGPVADAFLVALRLPHLVRRVLGEGGVNAGFVPLHARIAAERGEGQARAFAGRALSATGLAMIVLAIAGQLAAGALVLAMASGYASDPEAHRLATTLTRLAFPSIAALTLASLAGAILNANRRFRAAALAPLAVNGVMIAVLLAPVPSLRENPVAMAQALALALTGGAFVQLAVIVLALRGSPASLPLKPPRLDADMRRLVALGLPGLLAAGTAQLILLAAFQVASYEPSAVSHLHYADRLFQLPLGLIGVAVGIVLLPEIAAHRRKGDREGYAEATNRALEGALLLALPAAFALALLAEPIVAVLFERGAFGARDRIETAAMLAGLAGGLPFAVAAKVLGQGLFAEERVRAASLAGLTGIAVAAVACLALSRHFGSLGIGLGAAIGMMAHALSIAIMLAGGGLWRPDPQLRRRLPRILAASLGMGALLVAFDELVETWNVIALAAACIGGVLSYGLLALLFGALGAEELGRLRRGE